ncbi:hypothetical protein GOBAR_AA08466 [Gossypium barbadense]|uniref:Uncharacterized protein n=1 Tax=Gossypium barbadense TaxID=3634 RepID=A0A2P5Y9B6_GOSBA|nr:hypothetical protein GOBAR_AA08466 [Gossypium barbadense]
MKGGDGFRTTGKKISVALLALVLMTLLLWDWETNPFVYTHVSTQYQSNTPPGFTKVVRLAVSTITQAFLASMDITYEVCIHCDPNNSTEPMEPAETKTDGNKYQSLEKEEGKEPMENGDDFEAEMIDGSFVNGTASVDTKVCNYARGRWVADSRPPLYAAQCKYMERKWACRLSSRTDFSYEGYRWQSVDCQKPEFEASHFLERMKDKIVAFVGDTLSRQQFESMMCMLTGGQESSDIEDVQFLYTGEIHHPGWEGCVREIVESPKFLVRLGKRLTEEKGKKKGVSTNYDIRKVVKKPESRLRRVSETLNKPALLRMNSVPFFTIFSLFVLLAHHIYHTLSEGDIDSKEVTINPNMNTDQHWRKTLVSWDNEVMYVNGAPVQDRNLKNISNAMIFKVNNIVKWLDSKLASNPNLQVFFRTKSPTHFFKGDWDTGGRCDNTIPMTRGSEVFEDESSDKVVAAAVKGTRVKLLDITALSDLRDEAHNSYYGKNSPDCLHWCLPSVPDTWNELLNAQL